MTKRFYETAYFVLWKRLSLCRMYKVSEFYMWQINLIILQMVFLLNIVRFSCKICKRGVTAHRVVDSGGPFQVWIQRLMMVVMLLLEWTNISIVLVSDISLIYRLYSHCWPSQAVGGAVLGVFSQAVCRV